MRWTGCKRPQRKRTKAGMRCAQVCSNGRVRYLPNSECGLKTDRERQGIGCGCTES